jgi:hypothetical protein
VVFWEARGDAGGVTRVVRVRYSSSANTLPTEINAGRLSIAHIPEVVDFYTAWSSGMLGQDPLTPLLVGGI